MNYLFKKLFYLFFVLILFFAIYCNQDNNNTVTLTISKEAFINFSDAMLPILVKNGGRLAEPKILPVHNYVVPE